MSEFAANLVHADWRKAANIYWRRFEVAIIGQDDAAVDEAWQSALLAERMCTLQAAVAE
ncbi:MAG: hypothetical protein ACRESF_16370 [Pseudomonas sp.]